jgi:tetratricopeptide (TPR) repeat protein
MISILLHCGLLLAGSAVQTLPEKLIEEGHWKRARAIVEPWIRQKPDDALANFLLSQIRNAFHDLHSPLPLAEKAVQLDGGTAKYHRQLAEVLGVTAQHSGMLQQLFLARRFKKEIDTAVAEDPADLQALRDLMEFYLLAPGIAGGDRAHAQGMVDQIGRLHMVEGCFAQARLAEMDKDFAKQEALLRKAVEAEPRSYRARARLANFYLAGDGRNYDSSEQQAREAVAVDRSRIEGYVVLAEASTRRGNWTELEAVLADANQQVPDNMTPCYRAAAILAAAHREPQRAESLLRRYLAAEPEGNAPTLADAHWQLGLVLEQQSRVTDAVREWSEAVRLDPDSPARRELKRTSARRAG